MVSLVRWDPFGDLATMRHDMGRLVSDLGGWALPTPLRHIQTESMMLTPTIDVMRRGEDMLVRAEIPGVKPEEIDISVTENTLTLKGERREEHETRDEDYYVRESSYGTFERSLRLPEGAQVDRIHAEVHDGILEITVPKAAHIAPETRHVAISAPPAKEQHKEHH